jgi:hypothetical protein
VIQESDISFHIPDPAPFDWAETGYFNFYIPSANLMGWVYIVHRAGVGATSADVELVDRWSTSAADTIYINNCAHNPLPSYAERFALPSGVRFEAQSIRDYRIQYSDKGVELDISYYSLMTPYDIHDPTMDPMAVEDPQAAAAGSGFGAAYASHFDMTVRARGRLVLGGKTHEIDCVTTMDHSWGPRPETGIHPILWVNAHFGEARSLHGIFAYNPAAEPGHQHSFRHGYVLEGGEVKGCIGGSVTTARKGLFPQNARLELRDHAGVEYAVEGSALTHHCWMPYGNNLAPVAMMRWLDPAHGEGYGTYMEGIRLNDLRDPGLRS